MLSNLKNIQDVFDKMAKEGFDTGTNLKWGFFFFDDDKENLLKVYEQLKDHKYKLETLELADTNDWKLHISKIDKLTAGQLHNRNIAFNELAIYCNVELYDGWDVEKIN